MQNLKNPSLPHKESHEILGFEDRNCGFASEDAGSYLVGNDQVRTTQSTIYTSKPNLSEKEMQVLSNTFTNYLNLTLETLKSYNFVSDQQIQLACEYALKLTELEANVKLTQIEALKSLVQSESMIKSVRDNALISKANAYVNFLNVVLNAQNVSANDKGATHQNNVIATINEIGLNASGELDELTGYSQSLTELKNDVLQMAVFDNKPNTND